MSHKYAVKYVIHVHQLNQLIYVKVHLYNDLCILFQAGKHVRANDNVPLEDPGYSDLKQYRRNVLQKLGMQERLQQFERKCKVKITYLNHLYTLCLQTNSKLLCTNIRMHKGTITDKSRSKSNCNIHDIYQLCAVLPVNIT